MQRIMALGTALLGIGLGLAAQSPEIAAWAVEYLPGAYSRWDQSELYRRYLYTASLVTPFAFGMLATWALTHKVRKPGYAALLAVGALVGAGIAQSGFWENWLSHLIGLAAVGIIFTGEFVDVHWASTKRWARMRLNR